MGRKRTVRTLVAPAKPLPPDAPLSEDWNNYKGTVPDAMLAEIVKMSPEDFYHSIDVWTETTCLNGDGGRITHVETPNIGDFRVEIEARHLDYARHLLPNSVWDFDDVCTYSMKVAVYDAVRFERDRMLNTYDDIWYNFSIPKTAKFAVPATVDFTSIVRLTQPAEPAEVGKPECVRLSAAVVVQLFGA